MSYDPKIGFFTSRDLIRPPFARVDNGVGLRFFLSPFVFSFRTAYGVSTELGMAVLRKYQGSVGLGTFFSVTAFEQPFISMICGIIYQISLLCFDMGSTIRWYRIACMNSVLTTRSFFRSRSSQRGFMIQVYRMNWNQGQ